MKNNVVESRAMIKSQESGAKQMKKVIKLKHNRTL